MKLSKYLDAYHEMSGKASDVSRQLAFAGIAMVYIFKTDASQLPEELLLPSIFLVLSLMLDLMQYIVGALIWKIFHQHHESKGVGQEIDIKSPTSLSNTISVFYYAKLAAVIIAYLALLQYSLSEFF